MRTLSSEDGPLDFERNTFDTGPKEIASTMRALYEPSDYTGQYYYRKC
jgi:hypothetical protein